MGVVTVGVFSTDDAASLHLRRVDDARPLRGAGPAAYLDQDQLLTVASDGACDAIHPGYGFLAENAAFARRCAAAGVRFVGPRADVLELFGDKARARALAAGIGVPILRGTTGPVDAADVRAFLTGLGTGGVAMIKAVAGGGGRGMRAVSEPDQVEEAWTRCRSEALQAFGNGDLYVEQLLPRARHVEVQVLGDGTGAVSHLWERECTLQRRYQKLVEVAPAPGLPAGLRTRLLDAAGRLAREVRLDNLATVEFLIDAGDVRDDSPVVFIEANPRLQVEHTVTEEITGLDLVRLQLELASGRSLGEVGLEQTSVPSPRGFAVEARVNAEAMAANGSVRPSGGLLATFDPPTGPGVRVDAYGYPGYRTNPRFDSLLAKVIGRAPSGGFADAVARTARALDEFRVEGIATNLPFLRRLLRHPEVLAHRIHTGFIEEHAGSPDLAVGDEETTSGRPSSALAGARIDSTDQLAVLAHGKQAFEKPDADGTADAPPDDVVAVAAPMQGTIVSLEVQEGDVVYPGQPLLVMEAM